MEKKDLSYFRLSLKRFLKENHPMRESDEQFIEARVVLAEEIYASAFKEGGDLVGSLELANEALYKGLHFSKVSMIQDVIENEFFLEVQQVDTEKFARDVLEPLDEIFEHYELSDSFDEDSEQYNLLYTELTGAIAIIIGKTYGV